MLAKPRDTLRQVVKASSPHAAISYAIFLATAPALLLPGTVLPQLLGRWTLNDRQGGVLLFLFFASSSVGALAARGRLTRSIVSGSLVTAAGLLAMRTASSHLCFVAVMLMGAGLGLTMTSVSLLQSRWHAAGRAAELARLNLIWSLGACAAPSLLLAIDARYRLTFLLNGMAIVFVAVSVAGSRGLREAGPAPVRAGVSPARMGRGPWSLLLLLPLTTGVEASVGGWLSTYSSRHGLQLAGIAITITCFWLGLLLSRFAQSFAGISSRTRMVALRYGPWMLAGGLAVLVLRPDGLSMGLGALAAGFALGPLYPLALALWLERSSGSNLGFFAAGIGSSTVPLLTGLISSMTHSLGYGLLVPVVAAVMMILLATRAFVVRRDGVQGSAA